MTTENEDVGRSIAQEALRKAGSPPATAQMQAAIHERWSVKTGSDPDAQQLVGKPSTLATIAGLGSETVPSSLPLNGRAPADESKVERTIWQVDATLVGYKRESDQDYHLVLSDSSGKTMIAEIPDPAVVPATSVFLAEIGAARKTFSDHFAIQLKALSLEAVPGVVPMIVGVSTAVTVVGIGFFDFLHGQTGGAPNGVELHPVLYISFP